MFRIKTTGKNKAVFLSPFVFTEDQAERKTRPIKKWLTRWGWPKLKLVPEKRAQIGASSRIKGKITPFPAVVVWEENHPIFDLMMCESMRIFGQFEDMWEKLPAKEYAKAQKENQK